MSRRSSNFSDVSLHVVENFVIDWRSYFKVGEFHFQDNEDIESNAATLLAQKDQKKIKLFHKDSSVSLNSEAEFNVDTDYILFKDNNHLNLSWIDTWNRVVLQCNYRGHRIVILESKDAGWLNLKKRYEAWLVLPTCIEKKFKKMEQNVHYKLLFSHSLVSSNWSNSKGELALSSSLVESLSEYKPRPYNKEILPDCPEFDVDSLSLEYALLLILSRVVMFSEPRVLTIKLSSVIFSLFIILISIVYITSSQ